MIDESVSNAGFATIPRGVADYFWHEARQLRELERQLLDLFRGWGYGDVIPPMFEYADVLSARANQKLRAEMYRFLDRDGSTLALRPDMTIAVARLVSTRLHDWPMPQRFCYAGSVFRHTQPQAGREREFRQAGIELIGAATPDADAEVLALTCAALESAGVTRFKLVVGQMGFFHGLLDDLQLEASQQERLLAAVDRNSEAELADFLRATPLRTQQRRTIEELLTLSGPDADAVIAQADRLCLNYTMFQALDNLRALLNSLAAHGVSDRIHLDLTETYNLGYYTGITFEALTPELGFSVAGGGRYDNLLGTFGESQPAVGVALGVDRLLLARNQQTQLTTPHHPVAPDIIVFPHGSAECLQLVTRWRKQGLRVAVELGQRPIADARQSGRGAGAKAVLAWHGAGFDLYVADESADPPAASTLTAAEANSYIDALREETL